MGKNFRDTLNEQLKDPEFKAEWDALMQEQKDAKELLHLRERVFMTDDPHRPLDYVLDFCSLREEEK